MLGLPPIPAVVLNLVQQDENYYNLVERINAMLRSYSYRETLAPLSQVERRMLHRRVYDLGLLAVLDHGFDPLNWNSLAIPSLISSCDEAIRSFGILVEKVHKNASTIRKAIGAIRTAQLVDVAGLGAIASSDNADVFTLESLCDSMEKHRLATVEEAVHSYKRASSRCSSSSRRTCARPTRATPTTSCCTTSTGRRRSTRRSRT